MTHHTPAGTVIAARRAGHVDIHISTTVDGYAVTCFLGAELLSAYSSNHATLDEARNAANGYRDLFRAYGTPDGVAAAASHAADTLTKISP